MLAAGFCWSRTGGDFGHVLLLVQLPCSPEVKGRLAAMPLALGGVPIGVPPAEPGCPPACRLRVGRPLPAGEQAACLRAVHGHSEEGVC